MALKDSIFHVGATLLLERPVSNRTEDELIGELESTCQKVMAHLSTVSHAPVNLSQVRHIIGIERWGQSRLRAALGEPIVLEEYDSYRPAEALSWNDLVQEFENTRNETIALVRKIDQGKIRENFTIRHNQFGALSVRAWIRYLNMHARGETMRLR